MRLIFFIKYRNYFKGFSFIENFLSFIVGLRFDLSTISLVFGIFFLILHLPGRWKENKIFSKILWFFIVIFSVLTYAFLFTDIFYYEYGNKHLSFEIFEVPTHFLSMVVTVLMEYWYALVIFVIFMLVFSLLWFKIKNFIEKFLKNSTNIFNEIFYFLIFSTIITIFIRGGLQGPTLRPSFAFRKGNILLGHLSLNGVYTVLHTIYQPYGKERNFFPDDKATEIIRRIIKSENEIFINDKYPLLRKTVYKEPPRKLNVVIFIMESWTAEYTGCLGSHPELTPFFDSLSKEGLLFSRFYSCGGRTWQGAITILFSLPTVYPVGITYPPFDQNIYRSIAHILKEQGYETIFLHGGKKLTFSMEILTKSLGGFDKCIFKEDFDLSKVEIDKAWGVHDEHVFLRADEEFRKLKQPFLGVIFSLSSHPPYDLPERFKSSGTANFFDSIRYADYSLKKFFEKAKNSDYFNNTLFIITADHANRIDEKNPADSFRIPCLFYTPGGQIKKGITHRIGNQIDILPSVIDILKISTVHSSAGKSLFDKNENTGYSFMTSNEEFYWVRNKYVLIHNLEKPLSFYSLTGEKVSDYKDLEEELLSFCQICRKILKDNLVYNFSKE
ncbi:MAG: sulfatase-like hydrolase/transferase [Candidatus Omnitrophica bacterium]|nr:sulfatase-like hydrolase/transferase [Candidatus Omnitrophota bacterium]